MARPSVAQARTNRLARRAERRAQVARRAAARAAHRAERHTVASHLHAFGINTAIATAMANTVRKQITTPGTPGFAARSLNDNRRRRCVRYTQQQVMDALTNYKPRKGVYKAARAQILGQAA